MNRLEPARKSLEDALRWNRDSPSVYHFLGLVSLAENQPISAKEYLEKSTQANPDNPLSWFHLGQSYMRQKKWMDALKCFDKSHRLDNQNSETLYNLGQVYKKMGEEQLSRFYLIEFKAQSDFEKHRDNLLSRLQMQPTDLILTKELAALFEQNGRHDKAIVVWKKAHYYGDSTAMGEITRIKRTMSKP